MKIVFKTLYIYISNLGLFAINLLRLLFKTVLSVVRRFFRRKPGENNTEHIQTGKRNIKVPLIAAASVLIVAGIAAASVTLLSGTGTKIHACLVTLGGEEIGCTETAAEAEYAEALAMTETGSTDPLEIEYRDIRTEPYNIVSTDMLFEEIMKRAFPDYSRVCEIYVGSSLLCAVNDMPAAKAALDEYLIKSKKQYPNASVSFSKEVSFKYAYRKNTDDIWSADTFRLSLKTIEPISIQHVECEKEFSAVDYDTVEIETNKLFIGDSRVRREGKDGNEYVISLVTYNGNKKVLSQHLTSLQITPPVSKIVERGMRAQSLSIGAYSVTQTSGSFCWPVVGLYNVTSNYGYRSLGYHHGIDISGASAAGSLVVAGAAGTVVEAGWNTGGYGNYVIIDHGNGVETLYGHMLDNSLMVSKGDTVTKGQAIGRVGNTGYSFGAHLHFEVRINGNRINPAPYLGLE